MPSNPLAGLSLDRRSEFRDNTDWLEKCQNHPTTCVLLVNRGRILVRDDPARTQLALLDPGQWQDLGLGSDFCAFLGMDSTGAVFAHSIPDARVDTVLAGAGYRFAGLRSLLTQLDGNQAGLAAYARALDLWQANHRFCGRCAAPTRIDSAGFRRLCTNTDCALEQFPRLDPAIIVIIGYRGRCLLGRQTGWPPGVYSTLAGFVEPGESLEDAVHREVAEEAGVQLASMQYHSSQPWPFPSSLMLGFVAEAASDTICLGDELEDVRWFDLEQLRRGVGANKLVLSSPVSVSHRLIRHWIMSEHGVDPNDWRPTKRDS